MLHLVGFLLNVNYDARNHELKYIYIYIHTHDILSRIIFIVWYRVLCERWSSSCAWCELWKTYNCLCGVMCRVKVVCTMSYVEFRLKHTKRESSCNM